MPAAKVYGARILPFRYMNTNNFGVVPSVKRNLSRGNHIIHVGRILTCVSHSLFRFFFLVVCKYM